MSDDHTITASWDTLDAQAVNTVRWMRDQMQREIDDTFGKGWCQQHPELPAASLQAVSTGLHAAYIKLGAQDVLAGLRLIADETGGYELGTAVSDAATEVANAIEKLAKAE